MRRSASPGQKGNSSAWRSVAFLRFVFPRSSKVERLGSQYLSGFFKADLPSRRFRAETALRTGAEPIAELRRNVPKRSFRAQFQGSVHWPVRIIKDFAADRDQISVAFT